MNRADRRAKRADEGRLLRRINGGCDDCSAYSDLVDAGGSVFLLMVKHDSSCPSFQAMERNRTA